MEEAIKRGSGESSGVGAAGPPCDGAARSPVHVAVDPFRAFLFPNRIREQRRRRGFQKLASLATALPEIPYIRLSKIERGEVSARADELVRIARALRVQPTDLLIDPDQTGFDIAEWALPFLDGRESDPEEERFAMKLGAALRARRHSDRSLTISALEKEFGLPPVILSRIENGQKTLARWNPATVASLCRIFGAGDEASLRHSVEAAWASGALDPYLQELGGPEQRLARSRAKFQALEQELRKGEAETGSAAWPPAPRSHFHAVEPLMPAARPDLPPRAVRTIPVLGSALPDGLVSGAETGDRMEAPAVAGPRAFGLRVCRPSLGGGLPAQATVVIDPDRFPAPGGLAALREEEGYRILAVTLDRNGGMRGYSISPALEVSLDGLDPGRIGAVIAAAYV